MCAVPPFTFRMPTDRRDNADGANLNVGTGHVDVQVIIDPMMTLRGECRNGYGGPVIALREWDEQVFLHELLHAAVEYAQPPLATTYPPHGHDVISRIEVALWETGWRMTGLRVRRIHEPHCNTACGPGTHYLSDGVGMPHMHRTDLGHQCGECVSVVPPAATGDRL